MNLTYRPDWVEGDDILAIFEARGITGDVALEWLARAYLDRGLCAEHADPERDLFRLPCGASVSDLGQDIEWSDPTVWAWYDGHIVRVYVQVSAQLLRRLLPEAPKGKRGRKPSANWEVIDDLLRSEIEKKGFPDRENPPGWQCQADVERWAAGILDDRRESAVTSTIRSHVSEMLARIREAGN